MPEVFMRDGARLSVDVTGQGRAVVLISGLGGTAGFWKPLSAVLGAELCMVSFDQRGIGASERGTVPVSVRALAQDVWEIVDALAVEAPVLVGHSTGGAIVQEMALMRPGAVSDIVLSGTWAGPDPFMQALFGARRDLLAVSPEAYAALAALLATPPRWQRDHPEALERAKAQAPSGDAITIVRERVDALLAHDCRQRLREIRGRALVIGAQDDMVVPAYLQEEIAAAMPGAALHLFDDGGHFFPVTRAEETAAVIGRWLDGASSP